MKPFRLQRLPGPPEVMQARQNVCCRHPCLRRRHRGPSKAWVAGIPVVAAGTAGTAGPAEHGLQASLSSPQAPQARQNVGCRHPCPRRRRGPDPLLFLIRVVAGTAKPGLQACLRGLQASLSSSQAPPARENRGCRHPLPPRRHRRPSLRGLQASLPSSQAPHMLQIMGSRHVCVGGRHPCRRRRHRRQGKTWVASILFLAAAIAGPAKRGLQASLPSS